MFKKYNSIENTYRAEYLSRIKGHDFWHKTYVVQEKAHGSNLSFWTLDGEHFVSAKRSENIGPEDRFYNHQNLLARHKEQFAQLWNTVRLDHKHAEQMTIFGEVIGGSYPHKEIAKDNKAIKVQKGIFYSPGNEFYVFDIQINRSEYLDVKYTNEILEKSGLLYAKTLFQGSIEDCMSYPNMFDSVIPEQLGLPPIEPNHCEGAIIRPLENCYFNNGTRVIMKHKNDKWSENLQKVKTIRQKMPLPAKVLELQTMIKSYVSANRLNNVLSKIGEVTKADFGTIIGNLNRDIIEDFTKDYKVPYESLEKKERKLVTKSIVPQSAELIKTYFRIHEAQP